MSARGRGSFSLSFLFSDWQGAGCVGGGGTWGCSAPEASTPYRYGVTGVAGWQQLSVRLAADTAEKGEATYGSVVIGRWPAWGRTLGSDGPCSPPTHRWSSGHSGKCPLHRVGTTSALCTPSRTTTTTTTEKKKKKKQARRTSGEI